MDDKADEIAEGGDSGAMAVGDEANTLNRAGFLTAATTATVVRDLHWACESLFELFVQWASEVDSDGGDVAVWFSVTGRHLESQAEDLKALMPDSVLLGELTGFGAPSAASSSAVEAIRAIPDSVARLAIAQRVLLAQLGASCDSLRQVATPHADAPLLRRVEFLLVDLRNDLEAGRLLLERRLEELSDTSIGEEISAAATEVKGQLVAAHGLVPAIAAITETATNPASVGR